MKKSLLLLVAGAMAISASAQYAKSSSMLRNPSAYVKKSVGPPNYQYGPGTAPGRHSAGRTTSIAGACVYTETFPSTVFTSGGSGGVTDIWTTGANTGTTLGASVSGGNPWKWTSAGSGSGHSVGPLASTTAANGWVIFDADSIHSLSGASGDLPGGWIQSPAINCSALTTVGLQFQQLFEMGIQDTCVIEVSTSSTFASGVTYYPINRNTDLFTESSTANPDTEVIDITSAAAGHAAVYIRFVFQDIGDGTNVWDFSWLIDDVCVGALATHDVELNLTYLDQPFGGSTSGAFSSAMFGAGSGWGEIPQQFVTADSIYPVTTLINHAHTTEASVPVTCTLAGPAGAAAYSPSYIYPSLPIGAWDSGLVFPGYWSNTVGTYTFTFNAGLTGDADPANNTQTAVFKIDDTIWNVNNGPIDLNSAYYLYATAASIGASAPLESCTGARFDAGPGVVGDTVSGFGVAFASFSTPGAGKVSVQLYSNTQGSPGWTYVGESFAHSIGAGDLSTSSGIHWDDFRCYNGYGAFNSVWCILQPNTTYAAIVQLNGITSNLLIYSTEAPDATYFNGPGYFGQSGTSTNSDANTDFGSGTDRTGTTYVPTVQMYFGNIPTQRYNVGVNNVNEENSIGTPFPNPSNYSFTIPFTLVQDNNVTVTLMDMMGQVINTQNFNAIGGKTSTAVFNTSNLAEGIYLYSVQANGVNTTGRVVVAH